MIENAYTGERVEFVEETPELLVMVATWTRPGRRAMPHRHPRMQETWQVLEGRIAVQIGEGPERLLEAGEAAVAPAGARHEAWNPTEGPVRVRIEMRPALRWREFVERLFAGGEDPRNLLVEFQAEIAP